MRSATNSGEERRIAPRHGTPPRPTADPTAVSTGRLDMALLVLSVAVGLALVLLATAVFIRIVGG